MIGHNRELLLLLMTLKCYGAVVDYDVLDGIDLFSEDHVDCGVTAMKLMKAFPGSECCASADPSWELIAKISRKLHSKSHDTDKLAISMEKFVSDEPKLLYFANVMAEETPSSVIQNLLDKSCKDDDRLIKVAALFSMKTKNIDGLFCNLENLSDLKFKNWIMHEAARLIDENDMSALVHELSSAVNHQNQTLILELINHSLKADKNHEKIISGSLSTIIGSLDELSCGVCQESIKLLFTLAQIRKSNMNQFECIEIMNAASYLQEYYRDKTFPSVFFEHSCKLIFLLLKSRNAETVLPILIIVLEKLMHFFKKPECTQSDAETYYKALSALLQPKIQKAVKKHAHHLLISFITMVQRKSFGDEKVMSCISEGIQKLLNVCGEKEKLYISNCLDATGKDLFREVVVKHNETRGA